jgi:integrase
MGDSGLRRVEAARARREDLRASDVRSELATLASSESGKAPPAGEASRPRPRTVWTLTVVGKRRKQRTVPVSGATLNALRAHWADRDRDFDGQAHGPLIAPVWIPETNAAHNRHTTDDMRWRSHCGETSDHKKAARPTSKPLDLSKVDFDRLLHPFA